MLGHRIREGRRDVAGAGDRQTGAGDPATASKRKGTPLRPRFKRNLRFGQTPFDDLDRETLIRLLCTYHVALGTTRSALAIAREQSRETYGGLGPFWAGPQGLARRALARADYLLGLVRGRGGRREASDQHTAFLRHVDELAFPPDPADDRERHPTMTCERCQVWCRTLSGNDPRPFQGNMRLCGPDGRDCPVHRSLTWDILRAGEIEPAEARPVDGEVS